MWQPCCDNGGYNGGDSSGADSEFGLRQRLAVVEEEGGDSIGRDGDEGGLSGDVIGVSDDDFGDDWKIFLVFVGGGAVIGWGSVKQL